MTEETYTPFPVGYLTCLHGNTCRSPMAEVLYVTNLIAVLKGLRYPVASFRRERWHRLPRRTSVRGSTKRHGIT